MKKPSERIEEIACHLREEAGQYRDDLEDWMQRATVAYLDEQAIKDKPEEECSDSCKDFTFRHASNCPNN